MKGRMITRPVTSLACKVWASSTKASGPSYSSPWLPPVSKAQGPSPFFTWVTGIWIAPQALSLRL